MKKQKQYSPIWKKEKKSIKYIAFCITTLPSLYHSLKIVSY